MAAKPTYLLNDIPTALRQALTQAANEDGRSISGVVRTALMEHFELAYPPREDIGERMIIRASPELFDAVRARAEQNGTTMKHVIIEILSDRYVAA